MANAFPPLTARAVDGTTVMTGSLPDQAALFGVLGQVEAFGLELLGVRVIRGNGQKTPLEGRNDTPSTS
jgi:hypothetical protein